MYNFLSNLTSNDLFQIKSIKMSDTAEVVDLASKTVTELKAECKARNLPVSGKKSELISRFVDPPIKFEIVSDLEMTFDLSDSGLRII